MLLNLLPQLSALHINLASPLQASLCCSKLHTQRYQRRKEKRKSYELQSNSGATACFTLSCTMVWMMHVTWTLSRMCNGTGSTDGLWSQLMGLVTQNNAKHWGRIEKKNKSRMTTTNNQEQKNISVTLLKDFPLKKVKLFSSFK